MRMSGFSCVDCGALIRVATSRHHSEVVGVEKTDKQPGSVFRRVSHNRERGRGEIFAFGHGIPLSFVAIFGLKSTTYTVFVGKDGFTS